MRARARSRRGNSGSPNLRASISWRRAFSRVSASLSNRSALDCADSGVVIAVHTIAAATQACTHRAALASDRALAKLRIDFLEVPAINEDFARFAAGARRHKSLGLHHVDQSCSAAEANPQSALQVRDRHLSAAHNDAGSLVVEIILLELHASGAGLFVFG